MRFRITHKYCTAELVTVHIGNGVEYIWYLRVFSNRSAVGNRKHRDWIHRSNMLNWCQRHNHKIKIPRPSSAIIHEMHYLTWIVTTSFLHHRGYWALQRPWISSTLKPDVPCRRLGSSVDILSHTNRIFTYIITGLLVNLTTFAIALIL
jgi:hypothetical protein